MFSENYSMVASSYMIMQYTQYSPKNNNNNNIWPLSALASRVVPADGSS